MPEYSILGKRAPRVDALMKATGKALYSADFSLPDMLYGKTLRSPHAHALIRRLDISRARALKGVKAVITAADIPERRWNDPARVPLLAVDKAVFAGQPVAIVAAVNQDTALEALKLIEVEYETLPPVMDVMEAMKPDAPLIYPNKRTYMKSGGQLTKSEVPSNIAAHIDLKMGDIEFGFKDADFILENTFNTQRVHQGYLEPRSALAGIAPDGKITIWTDNQGTFLVREICADFLDVPLSQIKVMPVEIGGAFGAKQAQPLAPLCALLARKTGRPVKMTMTREEDFTATCPAPASTVTIKMGATKEGLLTAVETTLIYDMGAFHRESTGTTHAATCGLSLYRIPNLSVNCYDVVTNKAPTGSSRAPGASETAFAVESQMDLLARVLNMDPLEFRLKNAVNEGNHAIDGTPFGKIGFSETLQKMQEHIKLRGKPETKNRGTGVACGLWYPAGGACGADINLTGDGTINLIIGSCDLTGTRTSLVQIVAEEFGISIDKVTVITGNTDTAPHSDVTNSSRITRQMGTAVYRACQDAKVQLTEVAAAQLDVKPHELHFANGQVFVQCQKEKTISLAALVRITIGRGGNGPVIGRGTVNNQHSAPIFAVQMAEVEVDRETGKVKLLSFAAAQDVGFAINPTLIEGQIQGAVAQGIGRSFMEDYAFRNGIMQNPNFLDYRMPTSVDLPFIDTLLVEVKSEMEPYSVRGVGEPPMIPTTAAVANAVHSATGVRIKNLPMTPEQVLKALKSKNR